jgi:hypothetical protein
MSELLELSQAGADGIAPLASYILILTDLAIAMLDSPSSIPPQPGPLPQHAAAARAGG